MNRAFAKIERLDAYDADHILVVVSASCVNTDRAPEQGQVAGVDSSSHGQVVVPVGLNTTRIQAAVVSWVVDAFAVVDGSTDFAVDPNDVIVTALS